MALTIEQALQQGVAAHKAGRHEEAERLYRAILQSQPLHPDANHNLGVLAVSFNKADAALPLFKTALEANPKIEQFWLSYIDALIKEKQFENATLVIEQAKTQGVAEEKLNVLETQLTLTAQVNESKLAVQNKSLSLSQKRKKLSEQKKRKKKATKQKLKANNPSQQQLTSLLEHYQNRRFNDAEKLAVFITNEFPKHQFAWKVLGAILGARGRKSESVDANQTAVALSPQDAEAHSNLGNTLKELGRLDEAEASCRQAIALKPDFAEAHYNLGITLQELGRLDEAEASYTNAIALKPDYAVAHGNLGITLHELGRLDEAEASFRQAIALKSDYAVAHSNLGNTLKELGTLDEAEASFRQAIALKPDFAEAHYNLGITLQELGRLDEALDSYKQAIALKPDHADAHCNLGYTLLLGGRLEEGLDEIEWRWKKTKNLSSYRHFSQPVWDGKESLQGKRILLWSEQGIGDTLNWASCLSFVAAQADHTILECQEKIVPLLARSFPNIEIKPEDRSMDSQRDDFDFHLPMGSLYRHFIPKIGINAHIDSYLTPDPVRVKFWRARLNSLGKGPYVGISWKSSEVGLFRLKHYPPVSQWSSVLTIPDVTFINLQYSDFADDLAGIKKNIGVTVHNFDDLDQYNNVDDVAALCAALDVVVSTKVTPLIFSSGVGTPTKVANWRQSTWNNVLTNPVCSSVEMFCRDTWEPWDTVFDLIAEDISKLKNTTNLNTKDISKG
jgi:tetratricopeptide (TPR) repeat protein